MLLKAGAIVKDPTSPPFVNGNECEVWSPCLRQAGERAD
jgi:hypothetical protein